MTDDRMTDSRNPLPVALTIAGSDSGGGAGIQADLKTFAALGVFGASVITAVTAQNPDGVTAIQGIDPPVVGAQIRAVRDYFAVGAAKTGMLYSAPIIHAVADALAEVPAGAAPGSDAARHRPPLVVDPVMVASSGARLLREDAIAALCERIIPLAAVVTPNMAEAALLAEMEVSTARHLEAAARALHGRFGVPVLVKGGHLLDSPEAVDCLYDGRQARIYRARFLPGLNPHGTGCTLSAAIAVYLLRGLPLGDAVAEAKAYLHKALAASLRVGKAPALNHAFAPEKLGGSGP
jgi:hydroxymethylpyrimidine/phosphomethylpyrimidine kinase